MKPTCWYHPVSGRVRFDGDSLGASWIPLYKQHEWVGLTDNEIKDIIGWQGEGEVKGYTRQMFDQIEAKLKEKNT